MSKQKRGKQGWVGGYVLGFVSVILIFFVVWQITRPSSPAPASAAGASPAQVASPLDDHDHAALEAEVAKVPRVTADELKALMDRNEAVVIDVRTVDDFVDEHIPGALQIPVSFIESQIPFFPRDKKLVTYCACPAEETSGVAVLIMQRGGLSNGYALVGGIDTWRARGHPTEAGLPKRP